jgi:hypothetical protein
MNHLTTLKDHLRLFLGSSRGTMLSDAKVWKIFFRTISERRQVRKSAEKIKSVWFFSRARLCQEDKVKVTAIFLRRNNCQIQHEIFYIKFDCSYSNQARTRPDPNIICCYQAQTRTDPNIICCYQARTRPDPNIICCYQARTRTDPNIICCYQAFTQH